MVDLHCHLLPGIDDGPATVVESLELAGELAAEGVRVVVATPHVRDDHPGVHPTGIARGCEELRVRIREAGIPLELVPGGEVDLVRALEASDEELRLVSYAQRGTDLLLETPYTPLPSTFDQLVFEVQLRGYRIVLAHPERNPSFQEDTSLLETLVERGVLLQLTASSLLRPRRSRSGRTARTLLREGLAHVIASDAHGPPIERASLSQGVDAARKQVGARADWMANDVPAAILAGGRLAPAPPASPSRRRGWIARRRPRGG